MNTLTASDLRRMLRDVHTVEEFTNAMRREVRVPETAELYRAADAIAAIRHKLLDVALSDVAIDPAALAERVAEVG